MINIELRPIVREEVETVWRMQVKAFSELLKKYQDYDMSPAAESMDKVMARFEQPWTTYYFIIADDEKLGYHRTGKIDKINDRMDIVYYEKDIDEKRNL